MRTRKLKTKVFFCAKKHHHEERKKMAMKASVWASMAAWHRNGMSWLRKWVLFIRPIEMYRNHHSEKPAWRRQPAGALAAQLYWRKPSACQPVKSAENNIEEIRSKK